MEPRLPCRLAVWAQEGGLASRGFGRPICKPRATTVVRGWRGRLLHLVNTSALPADLSAQMRKGQALPMAFPPRREGEWALQAERGCAGQRAGWPQLGQSGRAP